MSERLPVCFYLNLDRSVERNELMQTQLEAQGIDARRVSAVDGYALPSARIKSAFGGKEYPSARGIAGCFLSHMKAYQIMVDENIPTAVIMEDDITIKEDYKQIICEINDLRDSWDIVQMLRVSEGNFGTPILCHRGSRKRLSNDYFLSKYWWQLLGTPCYMITRDYASQLLQEHRDSGGLIPVSIDLWLFNLTYARRWPHILYKVNPQKRFFPHQPIAHHHEFFPSTVRYSEEELRTQEELVSWTENKGAPAEPKVKKTKKHLFSFRLNPDFLIVPGRMIMRPILNFIYTLVELLPWRHRSLPVQLGCDQLPHSMHRQIQFRVLADMLVNVFRKG